MSTRKYTVTAICRVECTVEIEATSPDVTDFQRDTGRLCVMLSRHRTTVIMAAYQNILERLGTYTSPGSSVTGETASWDSYTGTLAAT